MSLEDEKQQLRRAAKKKRAALAGQGGGNAAENLAGNFSKVIEAGGAEGQDMSLTVFGYWPMADEIDVRPLMTRHRGPMRRWRPKSAFLATASIA